MLAVHRHCSAHCREVSLQQADAAPAQAHSSGELKQQAVVRFVRMLILQQQAGYVQGVLSSQQQGSWPLEAAATAQDHLAGAQG